jgi:hypothetical protein
MARRSWTLAGLLLFAGAAAGQTQSSGSRPESLLPQGTIFFAGTDDLDAMLTKCKAAPIGKIFAEQEVRDFLQKPKEELRKLLDQGLAVAKQHPALANIELDPDKILAGPYGRAFVALTHVQLPPAERFDPAAMDIGLVLGLEPRAGAVDVLGLVRKILGAFVEQGPEHGVKIESVKGDGVVYDRVQAPGAPPICFANINGLSVLSISERALVEMAKRAAGGGPSLVTEGGFARGVAAAGAPASGDVVFYVEIGRFFDLVHQGISLAMAMDHEEEARPIVDKIFEVSKLKSFGPLYSTSTWRDGVAVGASYVEIDPSAGGLCALANVQPVDRGALKFIPKEALAFSLSSFELAPLYDVVMDGFQQAAPEEHAKALAKIHELETQVAGADAEGKPNWDLRRDLVGALAGRLATMTTRGSGSMLGATGDFVMSLETPNPDGLEKSLKHLVAMAGKLADNPINFKEQVYAMWTFGPNGVDDKGAGDDVHQDAKLQVLDPMSLGQAAALAGSLQVTYAFHRGKFWFATTTKALKKALDAQNNPPAESITAKPDFAARFVEPPEGAVLTSISYGDTAANFETAYGAILGAINMVMMMQGGADELPIDISLLPTAESISKHLFGTVGITYRVGKTGHVSISRGPLGAETGLAVVAGAAAVGGLFVGRQQMRHEQIPPPEMVATAKGDPSDRARRDLADLASAITVYKIEYGNQRPPKSLDDLVEPRPDYPKGLLEGGRPLPVDPWGHAYAYSVGDDDSCRIWSFGPNGVDDHGAGDDIVQRS